MTVVLRPPQPWDLPGIAELWADMQEEFRRDEPRPWGLLAAAPPGLGHVGTAAQYEALLRDWFHDPHTFMLVGARTAPPAGIPAPAPGQGEALIPPGALLAPPLELAGGLVAYMVVQMDRPSPEGGGAGDGAGQIQGQAPIGRLAALYVRPSLRRNGLARRMLEAGCGWLRAQGAQALDAQVLVRSREGMVFLSRAGFQLFSSVLRLDL